MLVGGRRRELSLGEGGVLLLRPGAAAVTGTRGRRRATLREHERPGVRGALMRDRIAARA